MKHTFLSLLLLGLIHFVIADDAEKSANILSVQLNDHIKQYYKHPHLLNEKDYRQKLYEWEKHNSEIFMLRDFPLDYYIAILKDHIKFLEDEIVNKANGARSYAVLDGTLLSAFSGLWGYITYDSYIKMTQNVTIASYIKTITKNTEIACDKASGLTLASYIRMLEDTCSKKAEITIGGIIMLGATSALLAGFAGFKFYEVTTYAKRLKEKLEYNKRILVVLEEIKIVRALDVVT